MTHFEAWTALCTVRPTAPGQPDHQLRIVVWADGLETAYAIIQRDLPAYGYTLRDMSDLRAALSHRNGALARSVSPQQPLQLYQADPHQTEAAPRVPLLSCRDLGQIAPLDGQPGVLPLKTSPDALQDLLFGALERADTPTAHSRCFALLDAAKLQFGHSEIEDSDLTWRCLFKDTAAQSLANVAPYLVELEQDNDFTRRLFTEIPEFDATMTSAHMWPKRPAIFLRSALSFDALWKHLRRFTKIRDKSGTWLFYRFWEPENAALIRARAHDPGSVFLAPWCGTAIDAVLFPARAGAMWMTPEPALRTLKPSMQMSPTDMDALRTQRQIDFILRLKQALKDDHPELLPSEGTARLRALYTRGREKGYLVEQAAFDFVRCHLLAEAIGLSFEALEHQLDPQQRLTALDRAKLIWRRLETLSRATAEA
ncbi:hypothetical protein TRM7557_01751 [Tritonibacter multivorans]|uniref:DUF4123 domain-containing protein n=1 Tax=Tritonibacter multivorans TaxID=928856 RepID=A0A0P1GVU8_9RHOB|nr:DUF4123 domain-containing protein [Tritonibacter multivorans]MDA7423014.1 DUF4123 domain-containing protein [Tritonibacter multivorans]CUH78167.1 hypothetical protein TRM7557_01751 [Tritonibacter multivorans]SFD76868.1 protein of unknown function [Tritonibacter multivorans]